jgi:hypothetical protein
MLPALSHTALPSTLLADPNAARTYARQALSAATRTASASDWRAFEGWCAEIVASKRRPHTRPLWGRSWPPWPSVDCGSRR